MKNIELSGRSLSTDKLIVLVNALECVPTEKLAKVKSFSLEWEMLNENTAVPIIKAEFFE